MFILFEICRCLLWRIWVEDIINTEAFSWREPFASCQESQWHRKGLDTLHLHNQWGDDRRGRSEEVRTSSSIVIDQVNFISFVFEKATRLSLRKWISLRPRRRRRSRSTALALHRLQVLRRSSRWGYPVRSSRSYTPSALTASWQRWSSVSVFSCTSSGSVNRRRRETKRMWTTTPSRVDKFPRSEKTNKIRNSCPSGRETTVNDLWFISPSKSSCSGSSTSSIADGCSQRRLIRRAWSARWSPSSGRYLQSESGSSRSFLPYTPVSIRRSALVAGIGVPLASSSEVRWWWPLLRLDSTFSDRLDPG